jgi:hypothetical protein
MSFSRLQIIYIRQNYKTKTHKEIAEYLHKKPKTIAELCRKYKWLKCKNYGETEIYLLNISSVQNSIQFIDKTENALRIKKWRLQNKCTNCTNAK